MLWISELGHIALILSALFALLLMLCPALQAKASPLAIAQFAFATLALMMLMSAFVLDDFSVLYVANHSHSQLPWYYKLSAVWGAHEGSMLLWVWLLQGWTMLYCCHPPEQLCPRIHRRSAAVLGFICLCFILFILFTSNPFVRLFNPIPKEGGDLNPLLQDIGFIIHPPMLYLGYVGFAIPFALALAILWDKKPVYTALSHARGTAQTAWAFLTVGITLGSWWAYYELGWGGWWFWDPVENAAFLPWLTGAALIHLFSLMHSQKTGYRWGLLLSMMCFALSLLGTFLVRSGVLSSVHTFASDPMRGTYLLILFTLLVGVGLVGLAYRSEHIPALKLTGGIMSKTGLLVLNNAFLVTACLFVLLGTLYPLVALTLWADEMVIGPEYFNSLFVPWMLPLLLLMGFAIHLPIHRFSLPGGYRRWFALLALCITVGTIIAAPQILQSLGIAMGLWLICSVLIALFKRFKSRSGLTRSFYGMTLAHFGLAIVVLGISLSTMLNQERMVKMHIGDVAYIGAYQFTLDEMTYAETDNIKTLSAGFWVQDGQKRLYMNALKRRFVVRSQVLTETAIDPGFWRDIYIALGDSLPDNSWSVRLSIKPFVRWIWLGGFIMAMGIVVSASHRWRVRN